MPYKYIGRTTDFAGKTLWEIVGNLKNHGVGRIVTRNKFKSYPEKSYMKILKVEALPNPSEPSLDNMRKVRVQVEKTFRGKPEPNPILIESASYKWDYELVPKDEEEQFLKSVKSAKHDPTIILPRTMVLPPVLRELILRDAQLKGEKIDEEPQIEIVYNKANLKKKYRLAEDGEKPDFEFCTGLGPAASPIFIVD